MRGCEESRGYLEEVYRKGYLQGDIKHNEEVYRAEEGGSPRREEVSEPPRSSSQAGSR
jgi:hypothetical protein